MYQLNLPSFDIKIGGTKEHPTIWDILRKRYVALTPEEWVRQHFVHFMINQQGFPPTLIANEIALTAGNKQLRADTVVYDTQTKPIMIVEYKAPHIAITQKTFEQIAVYNKLLQVDYLLISNGLQHYGCKVDYENQKFVFLDHIPHYDEL